jgi:spore maturation protein CgeB
MKFVLFYHSLLSDWNHDTAHFLRGIAGELLARGHRVAIYEPADGWSLHGLVKDRGRQAISAFRRAYPQLSSRFYTLDTLDLDRALDGAHAVIVHEWNDPELVRRVGERAARLRCRCFFHDTHHRSLTAPDSIAALDLRNYAGVLASGRAIAQRYIDRDWAQYAWVWHEAADTRRFHPLATLPRTCDLIWIGNWGDAERTAELREFLIEPAAALRICTTIFGERYPSDALQALNAAGIAYGGWLPNYEMPQAFACHACTVHLPRRAYAETLAGVPNIRVFEALACGIPLLCASWYDAEHLFRPGTDYLVARDGAQMRSMLRDVLCDPELAHSLAAHGLQTVTGRHTCKHRVDELLAIVAAPTSSAERSRPASERRAVRGTSHR